MMDAEGPHSPCSRREDNGDNVLCSTSICQSSFVRLSFSFSSSLLPGANCIDDTASYSVYTNAGSKDETKWHLSRT